jgi:fructokinase
VLDPDIIVLGGGVSKTDLLYDEGIKYVEKYVFSEELLTPIVRHTFGDSAGVFGAAFLV